jgi:serine kinase of HPr protein (carbohydrate metabolism regulator)
VRGPESAVHAVAFLIGEVGVLVTGASGAGKSSLFLGFAAAWRDDPVRLVADDRVWLRRSGGRILARPHAQFLGKIEVRGFGIRDHAAMPSAVIRAVVILESTHPPRIPVDSIPTTDIMGVFLPCFRLLQGPEALSAFITKWPHFHASMKVG